MFVIILLITFQLSVQQCLDKKVSITINLEEYAVSDPGGYSEKLLWHVAIVQQEEIGVKFLCSGTIVGQHNVLTAAPCVVNVGITDLRVVSGLAHLRRSTNTLVNPHSVFTVVKKYYNNHKGNLAILKLENKATFISPELAAFDKTIKYSKQCFTLGWGMHNQSSYSSGCHNPTFQDSIKTIEHYSEQSKPILNKVLGIQNIMGFSSMFMYQLSKVLDILPGFQLHRSNSKMADDAELVCPVDESPRLKAVKMTTKHPYKCLCRNTSHICLYSIATDIIQQVDIGSPVFCKEKKSKLTPRHLQTTSKFVLAGVVSNKRTEEIRWLKFESPIKMITATNVTIFTDFILAVMFDKN